MASTAKPEEPGQSDRPEQSDPKKTEPDSDEADPKLTEPPWWVLKAFVGAVPLLLGLYGWSVGSRSILLVETLIGTAALLFGGMLGFLFGLPRGIPADTRGTSGENTTALRESELSDLPRYHPSNNLEQVSDWLTKILIGVGLVELGKIGNALADAGTAVARSFPAPPASPGLAIITQGVIVASVILGFLGTFLWTRIHYPEILTKADVGVWAELRRIRSQVRNNTTAVTVVAKREQSASVKTSEIALTKGEIRDPVMAAWPVELRRKVSQFLEAEPDYDTDPAADIFPDARKEVNGRRLEAEISAKLENAFFVTLRVKRVSGPALAGEVTFLLHPTYESPILKIKVKNGIAEDTVYTEGAYVAIAIADDGHTVLGYDLSTLPKVPKWFRES